MKKFNYHFDRNISTKSGLRKQNNNNERQRITFCNEIDGDRDLVIIKGVLKEVTNNRHGIDFNRYMDYQVGNKIKEVRVCCFCTAASSKRCTYEKDVKILKVVSQEGNNVEIEGLVIGEYVHVSSDIKKETKEHNKDIIERSIDEIF